MTTTVDDPPEATALPGSYLDPQQVTVLLRPIRPYRVSQDGKGFSHVEAYEIRAHLNRVFGFARWSAEVLDQQLVFEDQVEKTSKEGRKYPAWTVCYRTLLRLTVHAPDGSVLATYTEGATGDSPNNPSRADAHDMALKTSQSQALKRAAVNLGDQFGLSLYNGGSLRPLVGQTIAPVVVTNEDTVPPAVDGHLSTPMAPERPRTFEPDTTTTSAPAPREPDTATAPPTEDEAAELLRQARDTLTLPPGEKVRALLRLQVAAARSGAARVTVEGRALNVHLNDMITKARHVPAGK